MIRGQIFKIGVELVFTFVISIVWLDVIKGNDEETNKLMSINNEITLTTRIYPKYGDSDYLSFFDNGGNLTISSLSIKSMKSAYFDEVTPAYYGNSSNLGD